MLIKDIFSYCYPFRGEDKEDDRVEGRGAMLCWLRALKRSQKGAILGCVVCIGVGLCALLVII